jgi:hypothetical protein
MDLTGHDSIWINLPIQLLPSGCEATGAVSAR